MKKILVIMVLLSMLMCCSCSTNPSSDDGCDNLSEGVGSVTTELYVGMPTSEFFPVLEGNDVLYYGSHAFILDDSTDVIVEFNGEATAVERIEKYTHKVASTEDFSQITEGMTLYEVVEKIGLPYGSDTFGMITLNFASSDGDTLRVYWASGSNMVVTSTVLLEDHISEIPTEPVT